MSNATRGLRSEPALVARARLYAMQLTSAPNLMSNAPTLLKEVPAARRTLTICPTHVGTAFDQGDQIEQGPLTRAAPAGQASKDAAVGAPKGEITRRKPRHGEVLLARRTLPK